MLFAGKTAGLEGAVADKSSDEKDSTWKFFSGTRKYCKACQYPAMTEQKKQALLLKFLTSQTLERLLDHTTR